MWGYKLKIEQSSIGIKELRIERLVVFLYIKLPYRVLIQKKKRKEIELYEIKKTCHGNLINSDYVGDKYVASCCR